MEFNLYKEQIFKVDEMKFECEAEIGMTSLSTKRWRIELVKKLSTVVKLKKVTFMGCTRTNIWALETQEGAWAKKVGFASLKKLD